MTTHIHIHVSQNRIKDAAAPEQRAVESSLAANAATRKATSNGTFENHYSAYLKHEDASKWWKAAGNIPKANEHLRQAEFHHKNAHR
jgi:hypothetical protein